MKTRRNPNDFVKLILYGAIGIAGIKLMRDYQDSGGTGGGSLIDDIGKALFGPGDGGTNPDGTPRKTPDGTPSVGASQCQLGEPNIVWSRSANTLGGSVRIGHKGAGGPFTVVLIPQSAPRVGGWADRDPQIEAPGTFFDDATWGYLDVALPQTRLGDWGTVFTGGGDFLKYRMVIRDQNTMAVLCAQQYGDPITID